MRGPDVPRRRPPGTLRLLFLGDSVTYGGSYVDDAMLFSSIAAAHLHARLGVPVEALDAGVNGWGPQNMLGFLRASGGFDSSVWVVTALADDLGREKTHVGEVPYFNAAPHLATEELLVLAAYKVLMAYKRPKPPADVARLVRRNLAAYGRLAARAHTRGAALLFVWHPQEDVLAGAPDAHKAAFLATAAAAGAPVLDLTPAYAAASAGRLYVDGLHLSRAGHAVAGDVIGQRLVDVVAALPFVLGAHDRSILAAGAIGRKSRLTRAASARPRRRGAPRTSPDRRGRGAARRPRWSAPGP